MEKVWHERYYRRWKRTCRVKSSWIARPSWAVSCGRFVTQLRRIANTVWRTTALKLWKSGVTVHRTSAKGAFCRNCAKLAGKCDALDASAILYIADDLNQRVIRWPEGVEVGIVVVDGSGRGEGIDQLKDLASLCIDRSGHLYVADRRNSRVQQFFDRAWVCLPYFRRTEARTLSSGLVATALLRSSLVHSSSSTISISTKILAATTITQSALVSFNSYPTWLLLIFYAVVVLLYR